MYGKILVALENGPADQALLPHVAELARQFSAELLLLHVADGWVARNFERLKLNESEEMKADQDYLDRLAGEFRAKGLRSSTLLALGDPPKEILKAASQEHCDLIAMTTHGHRWLSDVIFGSTISEVRHKASVPLFLVRALPPTGG